ncbi:MAG: GntR family transcriptional regulator [Clostridiales bacterium]|nr:GntR family transcriptional regulator [Clostridiales bacterium]MCI7574249.1 GntR family transcriptional regulator [Clostridiales bacterium]MDY5642552.1 GntR family transcriptional regulator [Candidatus Faecousia sp.]
MHLDYRDGRPIYIQIVDDLRQQIALGVLPPGEKLPSVRDLAAQLSINPNTIQRAYRQLEMEGWICTVAGKGCFACEKPSQAWEEEDQLMEQFTQTARQLLALGHTRQELAARLEQEDHYA